MRKLGQHFLNNGDILRQIAEAIGDSPLIIEIGPGHGELTRNIKETHPNSQIIALERDSVLLENLKRDNDLESVEFIEGNALETLPELVKARVKKGESYIIAGNIPYYITGHLLKIVGQLDPRPTECIFLIQKEVAERITAEAPEANRLAASVQIWAKPELLFTVSKDNFDPPPDVESAVIKITTLPKAPSAKTMEKYDPVLQAAFQQPRKTLLNNIATVLPDLTREEVGTQLKTIGLDPASRPQDLTIEDLKRLATLL